MQGLVEARENALRIQKTIERGQMSIASSIVKEDLLTPLLELLTWLEDYVHQRWFTLSEALEMSQKSRNYFEKSLLGLGGLNRLEHWRAEARAARTPEGIWLIHPSVVPVAEAEIEAAEQPCSEPSEEYADQADNIFHDLRGDG